MGIVSDGGEGENIMHTVTLCSSGLEWDEESLVSRYAFLRRRRSEVSLDLLYYPYWLFHVRGTAAWRFFGHRPLEMLLVVDARSGRCQRVSSVPRFYEEKLLFEQEGAEEAFLPVTLEAENGTRRLSAHVAPFLLDGKMAEQSAETFALASWGRRCNLPLSPRADISCTEKNSFFLYKPFWIMRPNSSGTQDKEKMFVFDATTGLGGVSEYWNVVEYILDRQKRQAGTVQTAS